MADELIQKFQKHEEQIEAIALAMTNQGEKLNQIQENMATKGDIAELSNTLDELVGLAKKKDQELVFGCTSQKC